MTSSRLQLRILWLMLLFPLLTISALFGVYFFDKSGAKESPDIVPQKLQHHAEFLAADKELAAMRSRINNAWLDMGSVQMILTPKLPGEPEGSPVTEVDKERILRIKGVKTDLVAMQEDIKNVQNRLFLLRKQVLDQEELLETALYQESRDKRAEDKNMHLLAMACLGFFATAIVIVLAWGFEQRSRRQLQHHYDEISDKIQSINLSNNRAKVLQSIAGGN